MKTTDKDRAKFLTEFHKKKERNFGRLMGKTKRYFDVTMEKTLQKDGFQDCRMVHISIMTYIPQEGISINGLTDNLNITKQAISQLVKELQDLGYLETRVHPSDKRIKLLFHTKKGEDYLILLRKTSIEMEKKFRKILGKDRFDVFNDILYDLVKNLPNYKIDMNHLLSKDTSKHK